MVGLPAANNDPLIPELRDLSNTVYNPVFTSFSNLQDLITKFSSNLTYYSTQHPGNRNIELLIDDINWAKDSLESDFTNLRKIENHIKFLNADETLTNQREIIGLFVEFGDFFQDVILTNLEEVLKGASRSVENDEGLAECFILNGFDLSQIIDLLKRYNVIIKLLHSYFKKVETEKFSNVLNQNGLTLVEFEDFKAKVDRVTKDLKSILSDLNRI